MPPTFSELVGSPSAARMIHRTLLGGLLMVAAGSIFLAFQLADDPLMPVDATTAMTGHVWAACSLLPIVVGLLVFRQRVPTRSSGQDETAFWREALGPALSVWVLVVSAGVIATIGALFTAAWTPVAVAALASIGMLMFGPRHFENRQTAASAA